MSLYDIHLMHWQGIKHGHSKIKSDKMQIKTIKKISKKYKC